MESYETALKQMNFRIPIWQFIQIRENWNLMNFLLTKTQTNHSFTYE